MQAFVQGASRGIGLGLVRHLVGRDEIKTVFASSRKPTASEELTDLKRLHGPRLSLLALDVTREESIAAAATELRDLGAQLNLVINAAGVLHSGRIRPEKRLEHVRLDALRESFAVNAFAPLLVIKHFLALLPTNERVVIANISARVGSIGDNRLGGWYSYRASKAAQNMFTRTMAIEMRRRLPQAIFVALHPGTVDTALSRPFQRHVAREKLLTPERAARQLLSVIDSLQPEQSGSFVAWDGHLIPW